MSVTFNTNLQDVPVQSIGLFFDKQFVRTPVTDAFFSESNIRYLHSQLEKALTILAKCPVKVPLNNELAQTMFDVCSQNAALANLGQVGLNTLNELVVSWETRIQYVSIRQGKLYDQYFINDNRMKVFPYPEPSKITKGEVQIDCSGYMLRNPWSHQYGAFLHDVLGFGKPKLVPAPESKAAASDVAFPKT